MRQHRRRTFRSPSERAGRAPMAALVAVLALVVSTLGVPAPAAGDSPGDLARTRAAAERAAQAFADAEAELGVLERTLGGLRRARDEASAELEELHGAVAEIAVDRYTAGERSVLLEEDVNRYALIEALTRYATARELDTLDRYRARRDDLERAETQLGEQLERRRELREELREARGALDAELARLERLERERRQEEQRRQAAARAAAEREAAREAAATAPTTAVRDEDAADRVDGTSPTAPTGSGGPADDAAPSPTPSPSPAPPPPPAPGPSPGPTGIRCPLPGSVFVDTWGAPRPGGRVHRGVDMFASMGTPVLAPVSGVVSHRANTIGGLSFHLVGDDGRYYYGTHLSAYGSGGRVSAGTTVGYVGDTGNAAGNPHLHLEIHINGTPVNPYPHVRAVC